MAEDPTADLETLDLFSETNHERKTEDNIDNENNKIKNELKKFWKSFKDALDSNIRGYDGQQRILSIIAEVFTYSQLHDNLNVGF